MDAPHKITIKNKQPGKPLTGANTEVLIDDQPLRYAKRITLEVGAREVATVIIELFADVSVEGYALGSLEKIKLVV